MDSPTTITDHPEDLQPEPSLEAATTSTATGLRRHVSEPGRPPTRDPELSSGLARSKTLYSERERSQVRGDEREQSDSNEPSLDTIDDLEEPSIDETVDEAEDESAHNDFLYPRIHRISGSNYAAASSATQSFVSFDTYESERTGTPHVSTQSVDRQGIRDLVEEDEPSNEAEAVADDEDEDGNDNGSPSETSDTSPIDPAYDTIRQSPNTTTQPPLLAIVQPDPNETPRKPTSQPKPQCEPEPEPGDDAPSLQHELEATAAAAAALGVGLGVGANEKLSSHEEKGTTSPLNVIKRGSRQPQPTQDHTIPTPGAAAHKSNESVHATLTAPPPETNQNPPNKATFLPTTALDDRVPSQDQVVPSSGAATHKSNESVHTTPNTPPPTKNQNPPAKTTVLPTPANHDTPPSHAKDETVLIPHAEPSIPPSNTPKPVPQSTPERKTSAPPPTPAKPSRAEVEEERLKPSPPAKSVPTTETKISRPSALKPTTRDSLLPPPVTTRNSQVRILSHTSESNGNTKTESDHAATNAMTAPNLDKSGNPQRPVLPTSVSQMDTQYVNMLLALDGIPVRRFFVHIFLS